MRPETPKLLEDIRDQAQFIVDDADGKTWESFQRDRRLRQSIERGFEVIGEAMRRLERQDPSVAGRITAYRQIIAFRNVLIHAYDVIDHAEVWRIVQTSLPTLKAEVEQLLRETENAET